MPKSPSTLRSVRGGWVGAQLGPPGCGGMSRSCPSSVGRWAPPHPPWVRYPPLTPEPPHDTNYAVPPASGTAQFGRMGGGTCNPGAGDVHRRGGGHLARHTAKRCGRPPVAEPRTGATRPSPQKREEPPAPGPVGPGGGGRRVRSGGHAGGVRSATRVTLPDVPPPGPGAPPLERAAAALRLPRQGRARPRAPLALHAAGNPNPDPKP